ncbi:hypothetical protein C0J52_16897 [Blattella germanica]|nr:hypothetical protein C0J52_16897 [Blattella germanica]
MLSKQQQQQQQRMCARGRTAKQCNRGLQEACGAAALPLKTVVRWVPKMAANVWSICLDLVTHIICTDGFCVSKGGMERNDSSIRARYRTGAFDCPHLEAVIENEEDCVQMDSV